MEGPERKKVPQFSRGTKEGGPCSLGRRNFKHIYIHGVRNVRRTIDIYMILEQ